MARVIRPSEYEAVVNERAHSRRCGFPTCNKHLPPDDHLPKYRINLAARQVVRPSAVTDFCCLDCAEHSARYTASLSDLHIQYRLLDDVSSVRDDASVRAKVVSKPNEDSSFADMLFELGRVARRQLDGHDEQDESVEVEVVRPNPCRVAIRDRVEQLSEFARLFLIVSEWCKTRSTQDDHDVELRKHFVPSEWDPFLDRRLTNLVHYLNVGDLDFLTDEDWIAVQCAIVLSLRRHFDNEDGSDLCSDRECDHRNDQCLPSLLSLTSFTIHHIECLSECFLERLRQ
uniref:RNA polymerase II subunit B1 CTD phosphatase RPAP2 homolog n=1 Tax=Spongospora subterranea TaxID=70186 RepID=A0A0H5QGU6_9EUKA|eukprot:CRZ01233.1 hypothetical protein [Spongospora subterranea]